VTDVTVVAGSLSDPASRSHAAESTVRVSAALRLAHNIVQRTAAAAFI